MATNKNSKYIGSLVSFIKDTKPYHSKLDSVIEEYQFSDEMFVNIKDRLSNNVITKAAWSYSHFANGIATPSPTTLIHEVVSPQFRTFTRNNTPLENRGAFKAHRDENTDLPLVPFAFDPTAIDGVGLADAFVQRNGIRHEPVLEGHDVYLSHGAYVFQVKQTFGDSVVGTFVQTFTANDGPFPLTVPVSFPGATALVLVGPCVQIDLTSISVLSPGDVRVYGVADGPVYGPTITERRNEGVIAHSTASTQALALDTGNPSSAISKIQALFTDIAAQLLITPDAPSSVELAKLQAIIDSVNLPTSYEALIGALITAGVPEIGMSWVDVNTLFSQYSTSLYFNEFTDIANRESAALAYKDVLQSNLTVTNITPNVLRPAYEEWTLLAASANSFYVKGSSSGIIGAAFVPGTFTSTYINFDLGVGAVPIIVGDEITLTPSAKISVHATAPLEAWSVIKVNPRAYSRPVLTSTRYGHLEDKDGTANLISVNDVTFPTSTIAITAIDGTTFSVTNTAEPGYSETALLNQEFNDGRLQFTVRAGSAFVFEAGDVFFIEIVNDVPTVADLDLYYGYDMDSYDAGELRYNTVDNFVQDYLDTLDFGYDSRFIGYDLDSFNLVVAQNAVPGREWRLRANANLARPLPLQNSSPDNQVNLIGTDDATNPDAASQFDMPNSVTTEGPQSATDPDLFSDLHLWYADSFVLEYLNSSGVWTQIAVVPVGAAYTNAVHGLSFTIVPAAKPFIASRLRSSYYATVGGALQDQTIEGGDVIYWSIKNEPPKQIAPSCLSSIRAPRLIMYGDSFHDSIAARWTLTWVGPRTYEIQGYYTTGALNGSPVSAPITVQIATQGRSYKNTEFGLHWKVIEGANGLEPSDTISFETYERKPMFLVHGSVSGWQADAEINKWYWNGKIGFKIKRPTAVLFESEQKLQGSPWSTSAGVVTCESVRADAPSAVYILEGREYITGAVLNHHWTMYRNGEVVADGETELQDQYVKITMPPAVLGTTLVLEIIADDFSFALGHDLAIIRTTAGRTPTADDFVLFTRTKEDKLSISIKAKDTAHAAVLADLAPSTIDVRFVDHSTGSGVPLSVTSPETAILQGWIPALTSKFNVALSPTNFSDPATRLVLRAAASGETIGTVQSIGLTPAEPVVFTWDSTFAAKYLPLNTEATIVTFGSGMNENVRVNMTDWVTFLFSGGGLDDSAMFTDFMDVAIADDHSLDIRTNLSDALPVLAQDGPFGRFLPGYDNLLYDLEDGEGGYYDAGQALTSQFELARALALQNVLTPQEQATYNDLLAVLGPYTSDPATMTTEQFLALLDADDTLNYTPTNIGFGIPAIGMAMDVQSNPNDQAAAAQVIDAVTVSSVINGFAFDEYGFDVGAMDTPPSKTVLVLNPYAMSQMVSAMPSGSYSAYSTDLLIPTNSAQTIELSFVHPLDEDEDGFPYNVTHEIFVWYPSEAAPVPVPTTAVERFARSLRFTVLPVAELKVVIS